MNCPELNQQTNLRSKKQTNRHPLLMAGILAISTAIAACCEEKTQETNPAPSSVQTPAAATPIITSGTIESKKSTLIPQISEVDSNYKFQIPADIKMNNREFKQFKDNLLAKTIELSKKMDSELKKTNANKMDVVRQFVYGLESELKKNPKGKEYIYRIPASNVSGPVEYAARLANHMGTLFRAHGYVFDVTFGAAFDEKQQKIVADPTVKLSPITNTTIYRISDGETTDDAPFVTLGKPIIFLKSDDVTASWLPEQDIVAYYRDEYHARAPGKYKNLVEFSLNPKNIPFEQVLKDYDKDTTIHELTHHFLGKKYPAVGRSTGANIVMNIPLRLPLPQGKYADVGGKMNTVNLHELCAVANELAHSNAEVPESFMNYVNKGTDNDPSSGYQLVTRILPLFALMNSPENSERNEILGRIMHNQEVTTLELNRFFVKTLSKEDIRTIGDKLYGICKPLMEEGEKSMQQLLQQNPQLRYFTISNPPRTATPEIFSVTSLPCSVLLS